MLLSPIRYISPPTSVARLTTGAPAITTATCRAGSCQNLPQGQLEAYLYRPPEKPMLFMFRNQHPLGTSDWTYSYLVTFGPTQTYAWRRLIGGGTVIYPYFDYILPNDQWSHVRLSWWSAITYYCNIALTAQLHVEEGGVWVDKGIAMDTVDQWADSGTNRVGFGFNIGPQFLDDLIIRGPS